MTDFVVGFAFTPERDAVLLIRKNRPLWQHGKLNGIGGHIEAGECPVDAMVREFREEAGVDVPVWQEFCRLQGEDCRDGKGAWKVYFARAFTDEVLNAEALTDEILVMVAPSSLPGSCLPNLRWLVPMALDDGLITPVIIDDRKG